MIRLLKATTISKKYLTYFYLHHPDAGEWSYDELKRIFEYDAFAEVGFWKMNLEKIGGYEVGEYYIDHEMIQKKWARERHVDFGHEWLYTILEEQIAEFKPDIIFEDDASYFNPSFRKRLKNRFPFIRHFIAWDGYIKSDIGRFEGCDLVLTCVEVIRQNYLTRGFNCEVLPFGFEPKILDRVNGNAEYQNTFVGNIIPDIHQYRLDALFQVQQRTGLDVWISNFSRKFSDIKKRANYLRQAGVRNWHKIQALERINHGEAYGLKMYEILHGSKITLNIHGDGVTQAGNMRLIEASGSGACLVTDYKDNIRDYFIPDEEIIVFSNVHEALEKITYLMDHEKFRLQIAHAGQQKVFLNFSFARRVADFDQFVHKVL